MSTNVPPMPSIPNYIKPKRISLKRHPKIDEKAIQKLIENDPSVLGLGDNLVVVAKELTVQGGGKVDFVLAKPDGETRYEVEVQLGATDPSHIIRTIEYWDLERARRPKREQHYAVLVAEDITHRFFNVVSLLNKSIALIAIQMQAFEVADHLTLVFTRVVDFETPEDDQEETTPLADRSYWEKRSKEGLEVADRLFESIHGLRSDFVLTYTLGYIQVKKQRRNFLTIIPQRVRMKIWIPMSPTAESEELKDQIDPEDVEIEYADGSYRISVAYDEFDNHAEVLAALIKLGVDQLD